MGFCSEAYTPLRRGFDTFDGRFVGEEEEEEQQKIERRHKKHKTEREKKTKRELSKKNSKAKRKKHREKKRQDKNKRKKTPRSLSKRDSGGKRRRGAKRKDSKGDQGEHRSDLYSRKAVELIKSAATDQPLFVYLSLFTKSYPRQVGRGVKSRQKQMEQFRRKNLQDLDGSVASVVHALKSSGRYANSVVIFISDNGAREWSDPSLPNHNAPLRGAKGSVYEGGTKVPALIHSPLVTGGRR